MPRWQHSDRKADAVAPKAWGWWTRHKLEILSDYLQAFVTATKYRSSERIYLDLFAGWPENTSRETGEEISGSARRALEVDPPFTRVCLFEFAPKAERLRKELQARYPNRPELKVYPGDCNASLARALRDLAPVNWAPTFAFIDQFAAEAHWSTLEQLARFKKPGKPKVELWILLGHSFMSRGLRVLQDKPDDAFARRLDQVFGTDEWRDFMEARRRGRLTGSELRDEFSNLMRWRLEKVLGYRETHAFTMKNTSGQPLYDMIFASDHEVGDRIMRHLYGTALARHEQMRREARALRRQLRAERRRVEAGQEAFFEIEPGMIAVEEVEDDGVYAPEPPREPFRLS